MKFWNIFVKLLPLYLLFIIFYMRYFPHVCMYVCIPFYVVHYHNNLMKAHHYHKSHQVSSVSLEKMNIIILVFKWETNKSMQWIPINRGRTWGFGGLILEMDKVDFTVRMSFLTTNHEGKSTLLKQSPLSANTWTL